MSAQPLDADLERLAQKAKEGYWNPYKAFDWPEHIDEGQFWMNPELLSVYGTPYFDELDQATLHRLSKWESILFYSLNVHGIREVLVEVSKRMHTDRFAFAAEFLHHFLGEENEHMWFFAKFCNQYGGKIYGDKSVHLASEEEEDVQDFLVFVTTVIFEEIVDYVNARIGRNTGLPEIIRAVNWKHHVDESRHVAFGRRMVSHLYQRLMAERDHDPAFAARMDEYVRAYMIRSIDMLYRPEVYKDAGIPQPFKFRNALRHHPARKPFHQKMLRRTANFFHAEAIISKEPLDA